MSCGAQGNSWTISNGACAQKKTASGRSKNKLVECSSFSLMRDHSLFLQCVPCKCLIFTLKMLEIGDYNKVYFKPWASSIKKLS